MSTVAALLAAASDVQEIKQGWGGFVFFGLFVLACLVAGIWWLSR